MKVVETKPNWVGFEPTLVRKFRNIYAVNGTNSIERGRIVEAFPKLETLISAEPGTKLEVLTVHYPVNEEGKKEIELRQEHGYLLMVQADYDLQNPLTDLLPAVQQYRTEGTSRPDLVDPCLVIQQSGSKGINPIALRPQNNHGNYFAFRGLPEPTEEYAVLRPQALKVKVWQEHYKGEVLYHNWQLEKLLRTID